MENNGLRFYQIFSFGGAIGVNSLSFGELIAANFIGFAFLLLIIGLIATFLPFILLGIYFLYALGGNSQQVNSTRVGLNIFAIISYIYFLIDYHFGFIGCSFINHFFGKDTLNNLCYMNTALMLINVILLFFGNKVLNESPSWFVRILALGIFVYAAFKVLTPISGSIIPNLVSRFDFEAYEKLNEEVEEKKKDEWVFNEDYLNEVYGTKKEEPKPEYVGPRD